MSSLNGSKLEFVVGIVATLISTFAIIIALIRPWLREIMNRKRLKLSLVDKLGDPTSIIAQNGKSGLPVFYYYLQVDNSRPNIPANNVRVVITGRSEKDGSGAFDEKPVKVPVPLTWNFPRENPNRITISKTEICALGLVKTPDGAIPIFYLSTNLQETPRNFRIQINPNHTCRFRIEVYADDCSSEPLVLQITNLNKFSEEGMLIEKVQSLT